MRCRRSTHAGLLLSLALVIPATAADLVVTAPSDPAGDANPGDGVCATASGGCSLTAAIEESEALAGPDVILLAPADCRLSASVVRGEVELRGRAGSGVEGELDVEGGRLRIVHAGTWSGSLSARDAVVEVRSTHWRDGALSVERSGLQLEGFSHELSLVLSTILHAVDSDVVVDGSWLGDCAPGPPVVPVLSLEGGSLLLRDSEVAGCPAPEVWQEPSGGGIEADGASVRVERSVLRDLGGTEAALHVVRSPELVIADSEILDNAAAGVVAEADRIELVRTRLERNEARSEPLVATPRGGGGARLTGGSVLVDQCVVIDNSAHREGALSPGGAGLSIVSGETVVRSSRLRGNAARASLRQPSGVDVEGRAEGGGLYLSGAGRVEQCLVEGNSASVGAGIAAEGDFVIADASLIRNGPPFLANLASLGGGLHVASGAIRLVNTTLAFNVADEGAELYLAAGRHELRQVTVSALDLQPAPAVSVRASAGLLAVDSVLAGGEPQVCEGSVAAGGRLLVEHWSGCGLDDTFGELLLGVDPMLAPLLSRGSTPARELQAGSPAVDAALACVDETGAPLTADQRGRPRPLDGDEDGAADCDLGATERCADDADRDGDGVGDLCDLCPDHPDPAQADLDDDGVGDVCDVEEPSAVDLRPEAPPLRVRREGALTRVSWERTEDPEWELAIGALAELAAAALDGSLVESRRLAEPTVLLSGAGGRWFAAAARRDAVLSSFGRDSLGRERPLP